MTCPLCLSKKTSHFAKKISYEFYRCSLCKSIFLKNKPSQKELNLYYEKTFSYEDGLKNEIVIRKRSGIILNKIKQLAPQANTICDVGSGYGFFLDEAQKIGYKALGIEPSKQLSEYASKHFKIPTFTGELDKYKGQLFEVVTCIHVVEHVVNPGEFVLDLLKLVKPGGVLYIETPNSDSHLLYAEKEHYTFLIPPDHLWLFSRYSIQCLLPKTSQIVFCNTYSYSEHFMGIIKQLLHIKKQTLTLSQNSNKIPNTIQKRSPLKRVNNMRKQLFILLFDRLLAPLFTGLLNLHHKGSILELYIKKK